MTDERIPLFPLRTVLFPGGPLSLRIFEPRYVAMVSRCMRDGTGFGVVLILEGGEVGDVAALASMGTRAGIEDFSQLPDGLLGILCRGEDRFYLLDRERQADGLYLGTVRWLPEAAPIRLPAEYRALGDAVRQALPQFGARYAGTAPKYDEAGWVGCRLAEMLPMQQEDRQRLLEIDDPLERLALLSPLLSGLSRA